MLKFHKLNGEDKIKIEEVFINNMYNNSYSPIKIENI